MLLIHIRRVTYRLDVPTRYVCICVHVNVCGSGVPHLTAAFPGGVRGVWISAARARHGGTGHQKVARRMESFAGTSSNVSLLGLTSVHTDYTDGVLFWPSFKSNTLYLLFDDGVDPLIANLQLERIVSWCHGEESISGIGCGSSFMIPVE